MNDLSTSTKISSLVPRTLDEAIRFSSTLAKSDIVPKDFIDKPANVLVAIQWGMELGLHPMQAMQSIAVINGRPSLWGDAVIALVRASGLAEYIHEEISDTEAVCKTKRVDEKYEVVRRFTVDDAKRAGLWEKRGSNGAPTPWVTYPKRMLQMRARAWALRDAYPDVLRGVHVAEEAQDIPVERDVTGEAEVVEMPKSLSAEQRGPVISEQQVEGKPAEEKREAPAEKEQAPATTSAMTGKPLQEGQLKVVRAKLKNAALTEKDLVAKFGELEQLRFEQFADIQNWIAEKAAATAR